MRTAAHAGLARRGRQVLVLALSRTARNTLVTFAGNLTGSLFSLLALVVVSRHLGPRDFGVLATFTAIIATLSGLTEFGLTTTAIKLSAEHLHNNRPRAYGVMRVFFKLEIASGLLVGLIGLFFSKPIASALGNGELLPAVRLAFVAAIFGSAAAFIGPFLVIHQRFVKNAVLAALGPLLKAATVVSLLLLSALSLRHVLVAYAVLPVVMILLGLWAIPKRFLREGRNQERPALGEMFHFGKWVLLSYIASALMGRLDIFLLSHYCGSTAVGLYAAAMQLAAVMPLMLGSVSSVLLPQISRLRTRHELVGYLKKVATGTGLLAMVLVPVLGLAPVFVGWVFGEKFAGSIAAFRVIFASHLLSLVVSPLSLVLYAVNRPRQMSYVHCMMLGLAVVVYPLWIPRFGVMGAASGFLLINAAGAAVSLYFSLKHVRRQP